MKVTLIQPASPASGISGASFFRNIPYQGLIQLAAGIIQTRLGHARGAAKLRAAAGARLARAKPMHGLDPAAIDLDRPRLRRD